MDVPTIEDLDCIIFFPKGSKGYDEERAYLEELLALCEKHGFGRIPQAASWIEAIWYDKNKVESFKEAKKEHFRTMREGWSSAFPDIKTCPYTEDRL